MMPPDDIACLRSGTPRQQAAWRTLRDLRIFERLAAYDPVLAGTIPIDCDIPGSDLDVICCCADFDALAALLRRHWGHMPGFRLAVKSIEDEPSLVCDFLAPDFPIQIFAQDRPSRQQRAYLHMLVEARLLAGADAGARAAIRALKRSGLKTEPAFAAYFGLPGDPYLALLELS